MAETTLEYIVDKREKFLRLIKEHEKWRTGCLNLVAAENTMSPLARSLLSTDLAQRYGDYTGRNLHARRYFGNRFIIDLETEVEKLAQEVFGARFVELRPISGHVAGNAVILSLCKPGDLVFELSRNDGGHRLATKLAQSPLIDLKVDYFPFDPNTFNIDVGRTMDLVRKVKPRLLIFGASNYLFPTPLVEIAQEVRNLPDTIILYDASHVLGLIAGKTFQDPLSEGAQLVFGGTQKSFPGPQGGIIYTNIEELIQQVSNIVYPGMLSNHHLSRILSLGITLLEMKLWGQEYANQVIKNSKALALELVNQQIQVVGNGEHYTQSHTVLINTSSLGNNEELGYKLEEANIITTAIRLPDSLGGAGLRLGTNELTRRGANEVHMIRIAQLIADVLLNRRSLSNIKKDVRDMVETELRGCRYTWDLIYKTQ